LCIPTIIPRNYIIQNKINLPGGEVIDIVAGCDASPSVGCSVTTSIGCTSMGSIIMGAGGGSVKVIGVVITAGVLVGDVAPSVDSVSVVVSVGVSQTVLLPAIIFFKLDFVHDFHTYCLRLILSI